MAEQARTQHVRVAIIGGGFSGLGVAIQLLRRGIRDFVILEKARQLGGTWRENTYPGCACDVPSQFYSFSYAPKHDWSRVFAEQPEIQAYLLDTAQAHGILPYVRLETALERASWDEASQRWVIETSGGRVVAEVVVSGMGPLHVPRIPELPGRDRFEGKIFHTAAWDHAHDLRGRRVAVVGTGSSAIQLIPMIQPEVAQLVLFQRTAPWVLPKPDHAYPAIEQAAFQYLPGFRRAYRNTIYGALELLQLAERSPRVMEQLSRLGRYHLRRQVKDDALRARLTPTFVLGCKRLLLSNTYYPAIQQDNVSVVTEAVRELTPRGLIGADGVEREVDTIVFATGFHVTDTPMAKYFIGRSGESLDEVWRGSPEAYLGTSVSGFPNLFLMVGPNLGNGHGSAIFLIEQQAKYIVDALETMDREGITSVDVRADVQARFNDQVQEALSTMVWNAGGCASYYLAADGKNRAIYPWTTVDVARRMRRFDASVYTARRAGVSGPLVGKVVAITGGARGIGLAAARRFSALGADVCIGDLDLEVARDAVAREVPGGRAYALDVMRRASFAAFLDAIEHEVGPIDVLVNNAGVMPTGRFLDESDEAFDAAMGVNVLGPALGMKLVLPRMLARKQGHVVNVASMAGRIAIPGLATYAASKHALVALSRAAREEIEGQGVTLSTVMPGAVRTRLSDGIPLDGLAAIDPDVVAEAIVESVRSHEAEIPVPRYLGLYPRLEAIAPRSLMRLLRGALRANRALTSADPSVRGDYESAIERQGARLPPVLEVRPS